MSNRIEKVNSLIQEELSQILLKEVDFPKDILVTITRVETVPNLSETKIYISVMLARNASPARQPDGSHGGGRSDAGGPENQTDQVFEVLNRKIYDIQQCLNRRLNMRPIPKIEFKKEEKTQQASRVEELLEEIKDK